MKRLLIILFITSLSFEVFSQRRIQLRTFTAESEIGFIIGGSYYLGDLNQFKQFYRTKPAFGLIFRKNLNPRYSLKLSALYGNIEAYDADSRDSFQQARNLGFRSKIIEASGQFEFNFLPYTIGDPETPFTPYLFTGLAGFYFNPQGSLSGQWVDLRDYSTEGQGLVPGKKTYSNIQVSWPFGGGVKMNLGGRFGLGLEWGLRKTFTDYLDDVSTVYVQPDILRIGIGDGAEQLADPSKQSEAQVVDKTGFQRGNPKRKDLYSFAGVTLSFRFGTDNKCHFKK